MKRNKRIGDSGPLATLAKAAMVKTLQIALEALVWIAVSLMIGYIIWEVMYAFSQFTPSIADRW